MLVPAIFSVIEVTTESKRPSGFGHSSMNSHFASYRRVATIHARLGTPWQWVDIHCTCEGKTMDILRQAVENLLNGIGCDYSIKYNNENPNGDIVDYTKVIFDFTDLRGEWRELFESLFTAESWKPQKHLSNGEKLISA